jgi:DNA gyrase subunit B
MIGSRAVIRRSEGERTKDPAVVDFHHTMQWLREEAERVVSTKHYKGLGEMEPDQLQETTMDPRVRSLLKMQIQDATGRPTAFGTAP